MNGTSESCFARDGGRHGTAEDLAVREAARAGIATALDGPAQAARDARQARLACGQWTDAGAGLQVRLA